MTSGPTDGQLVRISTVNALFKCFVDLTTELRYAGEDSCYKSLVVLILSHFGRLALSQRFIGGIVCVWIRNDAVHGRGHGAGPSGNVPQ